MATSKTLTPTNVTISIPEMTDSPDASVFSNCVDKEADAINSLNSKIDKKAIDIVTTGLTFTNCSLVSGGICRVANMVIIEMRVKITGSVPQWSNFVGGLPGTYGREVPLSAHCVTGGTNGVRMIDTTGGNIRNTSTTALAVNEEINIAGVFLAAS